MAQIFKSASLYYQGTKAANGTASSFTVACNGEDVITQEGWQGTTSGPVTTKATLNSMVPITGNGLTITPDLIAGKYVKISHGLLDGKIYETEMKCMSVAYENNAGTQSQSMTAEFSGGEPTAIG